MAARRYEIFLRVLKIIIIIIAQQTTEIFFNARREISYLQAVMWCSIYYINTSEISNHFQRRDLLRNNNNGDLFTCEDVCVFTRKLTLYFIGVHIVKQRLNYVCAITNLVQVSSGWIIMMPLCFPFGNVFSQNSQKENSTQSRSDHLRPPKRFMVTWSDSLAAVSKTW